MEEKNIGPILTREELFSLLDDEVPALAKVKSVAAEGRLDEAKHLFAEHVRNGGYAEVFFDNIDTITSRGEINMEEEKLKQEAARVLSHELRSVGVSYKFGETVDWFHNPTYNGYKEWTWQLSRHHDINILSKAYETFGDEKYAEGTVELLWSWIRQAVRPDADVGDGATLCWRTIECGIRMTKWPNIFFPILKSPAATDDFIVDFCASLYEHGERLIKSQTHNNWRNIELGGFASLAVLFPFFKVSSAWRDHVAKGVYDHLVRQIHPDGMQFELSTTYHFVVLKESMHGAAVLALAGYKMPDKFYEIITKMYEMHVKIMQAGNRIPVLNDGLGGNIKAFMPKDGDINETPLIKWAKAGCPMQGAPEGDTLSILEYAGLVTLRDSWVDTKCSVFFDAGKIGRSHQHEDKLNVIIFTDEKEILPEGHSYAYDTSPMRKYVLSTFSHNSVTVDGKGQSRKVGYKWDDSILTEKEPVDTYSSDSLDWARGSYNESYGEEKEITDVTHTREVALIKKPKFGKGTVIVIDRLSGESEHTYEAIWHTGVEDVAIDGATAVGDGISFAFGERVGELSVVKGRMEPTVQGFVTRSTIQGDYYAVPTVLNAVKAKDAVMLTVIGIGSRVTSASLDGKTVTITYENGVSETVTMPA